MIISEFKFVFSACFNGRSSVTTTAMYEPQLFMSDGVVFILCCICN